MQVESVTYIFTEAELAALAELLGCGGVPMRPAPAGAADGLTSLEESLLVTRGGESYVVDKAAAFFAKTIGETERYVCLYGPEAYHGLFYTPLATLALRLEGGRWLVTPFQSFGEGREALMENAPERAGPGDAIRLRNGRGAWSYALSEEKNAKKSLLHAAEWLYFDDMPKGKEATQWKP